MNKLLEVQLELKAPKAELNSFGNYNYRTVEGILEVLKPILKAKNLLLSFTDELVLIGDRYYIKATARLVDLESKDIVSASAFAREAFSRPKFDESQLTGSASTYARKSALCALLLIDDNIDADGANTCEAFTAPVQEKPAALKEYSEADFNKNFPTWQTAIQAGRKTPDDVIKALSAKFALSAGQKSKINGVKANEKT